MSQDMHLVQQEAATHQLGQLISVHKGEIGRVSRQLLACLAALVFDVAILVGAYFLEFRTVMIIDGTLGVVILGTVGYSVYLLIHGLTTTAYLFEQGVIVKKSSRLLVFPWNEIAQVWHDVVHSGKGAKSPSMNSCTIERDDKLKVTLDSALENISNLSEAILYETTRHKFPQALAELEAGQRLSFGSIIHLQLEGVTKGAKELLPWQAIEDVEIVEKPITGKKDAETFTHALTIKKRGGTIWLSLKASLIPNYHLLMKLIKNQLTAPIQE